MQLRNVLFFKIFIPVKNNPSKDFSDWIALNENKTYIKTKNTLNFDHIFIVLSICLN